MERDDRHALRLVGVAEDEPMRRLVEVELGDRQRMRAGVGIARCTFVVRVDTNSWPRVALSELRGTTSERSTRARGEKPFFETRRETVQESRIDGVDRDDAESSNPSRRARSPRRLATLPGARNVDDKLGIRRSRRGDRRRRHRHGRSCSAIASTSAKLAWFARKVYTEGEMAYAHAQAKLARAARGLLRGEGGDAQGVRPRDSVALGRRRRTNAAASRRSSSAATRSG